MKWLSCQFDFMEWRGYFIYKFDTNIHFELYDYDEGNANPMVKIVLTNKLVICILTDCEFAAFIDNLTQWFRTLYVQGVG